MKHCYLKGLFGHEALLFKGFFFDHETFSYRDLRPWKKTYLAMQHDGEIREIWKIMPELCFFLPWTLVFWPKHEIQALNIEIYCFNKLNSSIEHWDLIWFKRWIMQHCNETVIIWGFNLDVRG